MPGPRRESLFGLAVAAGEYQAVKLSPQGADSALEHVATGWLTGITAQHVRARLAEVTVGREVDECAEHPGNEYDC